MNTLEKEPSVSYIRMKSLTPPGVNSARRLCNKNLIFLFFLVLLLPSVLFFYTQLGKRHWTAFIDLSEQATAVCGNIPNEQKFDCYARDEPNEKDCKARGCCWQPVTNDDGNSHIPSCFYPKSFMSYKVINRTRFARGEKILLNLTRSSVYSVDVKTIKVTIKFETGDRLHIKIADNDTIRYEPPPLRVSTLGQTWNDASLLYDVIVDEEKFGFAVIRRDSGTVIFDARNVGGFVFSDQFLQISALLPSKYIYGLGERRNNFLLDTNWQEITLFNHDSYPRDNMNLYGTHPFYLAMEEGGVSHGVFLYNSNAMDIILQPAPAITYRTIGGILDFYFFLGPSPADVISQYHKVIGYPFLPPYWSLGFHLCRFGLKTLNDTIALWSRNRKIGLPFDVQWNDIDYMVGRNDFTINSNFSNLGKFVDNLHNVGMKYVLLVDPGVASREPAGTYRPYDLGIELDIFIKNDSNLPMEGMVWNRNKGTVFPDFTSEKILEYWSLWINYLHMNVSFDGVWLDMNEISNFVDGSLEGCGDPKNNTLDYPPYVPNVGGGYLNSHTLCMNGKHYGGSHYNLHNIHVLYQLGQTEYVLAVLRGGRRPFILSRSTFARSGKMAAHWTGDVHSTWDDMKHSVPDIMSFSMFGIPMVGADICGFNGDTTEHLCQRWSQLGAFYPFSRNHNSDTSIDQDPAVFSQAMINSTKKALNMRYKLLPYLYTLFWKAHESGENVIRPLFFEFPGDQETYIQSTQFLWGPALLIVPVLEENATTVTSYFPKSIWFDAYTLELFESQGDYITITAPMDKIPLYLRAGFIIPYQEPGITTTESRKNPFGLYVALDQEGSAQGLLYWDDGETYTLDNSLCNSIKFFMTNSELNGYPLYWNYNTTMVLNDVQMMGISGTVKNITINNQPHHNFQFLPEKRVLEIMSANIDLSSHFIVKLIN